VDCAGRLSRKPVKDEARKDLSRGRGAPSKSRYRSHRTVGVITVRTDRRNQSSNLCSKDFSRQGQDRCPIYPELLQRQ
jgi:hypothetical protein